MKANVGTADKVIRIIVGIVIIAAGLLFKSWWGVIGLIPLLTAFVGYCPLYAIIGVATCKTKSEPPRTAS
ncbi:MAG: YgaP family membrane protein [Calditrichota bacterium]